MQFYDGGPDIHEDLIRAQIAGEVVLVVGAGVSRRAGLPLFRSLVEAVYSRIGQEIPGTANSLADVAEIEAWNKGEWDRTLGLLEQRLVYRNPNRPEVQNPVREAAAVILQYRGQPLGAHQDILAISRDALGRPRVITTNFDVMFEHAWHEMQGDRLASFAGPGLPAVGSSDFYGIMHLHGRIADETFGLERSSLVLTSADFGEAYLRSGWASRFVYDLFRRYTVVFVGYGADDPPIRYMLEATEAGRLHFTDLRPAYAFASFGEGPEWTEGSVRARWRAKGLVPILYENADQSHDSLYRTLGTWAECSRDPAAWASAELGRITSRPFGEASQVMRAKVTFLTTTMSNAGVLSDRAGSPEWIKCLIDAHSPPRLDRRDAHIWFAQRLDDFRAARWAFDAHIEHIEVKAVIARAVQELLPPSGAHIRDILHRYWRLYISAFSEDRQLYRLGLRSGLTTGLADHLATKGVVEVVRPRLRIEEPLPSLQPHEVKVEPTDLRDLCRLEFQCEPQPTWREILRQWPTELEAECRLLDALGRALAEACDLARDAGLIASFHDLTSGAVQFVHELDPGEATPSSGGEFRSPHWRPTDIDEHNHSFVPIVRLMSGLWRWVAEHDGRRARNIARWWINQESALFRRLGFWAATVSEHGPFDAAANLLANLDLRSFWLGRSVEAARFWCRQWGRLPEEAHKTIEKLILEGPDLEWIWLVETEEDKRRAADLIRHRELVRITTAGGEISHQARSELDRLAASLEHPPSQVSVAEGLGRQSWFASGDPGDASLVADVPSERLLKRVAEITAAGPLNQRGLWGAVCRERPNDALKALRRAGKEGMWPSDYWRDYLSHQPTTPREGADEAQAGTVVQTFAAMPQETLRSLLPTAAAWLGELAKPAGTANLRQLILIAWDRLLAALRTWAESGDQKRSGSQSLLDQSVNHPAGQLASVLVYLQGRSPNERSTGLAEDLAPRFERLMQLPAPTRTLVLAPLVRELAFLLWLAPDWTEKNLFPELDRGDSDARQLLGTLVLYGHPLNVQIFNRLKPMICAGLSDSETDRDVRDRLAHMITWAIGLKMAGNEEIELAEPEARRLLTRSPSSALQSIAWGLWRILAQQKDDPDHDLWLEYVKPLLERVWPNDVVARSPEVSNVLIRIPAVAGEHVPDAAQSILRLIVPHRVTCVYSDFDINERPELLRKFPRELLDLVDASIDRREALPYDLKSFLDDLADAAPALRHDARYVALRNASQHL